MSGTAYNPFALATQQNHTNLAYGMVDGWLKTSNSSTCGAPCNAYKSNKNVSNLVEVLKVLPLDVISADIKANAQIGRVVEYKYGPVYEGSW